MKRYELLANELAQSIHSGTLTYGDRLPSVRQASAARGVSPSTVFEAYYLLEARGLVRARERSGYYVTAGPHGLPPAPEWPPHDAGGACRPANLDERMADILRLSRHRDMVPFGSGFPSPALLPLARLGRVLSSSARRADAGGALDDIAPGNAALRRQIALRYLADGLTLGPEDIVIAAGAMDALTLCMQALTRPGDAVLIEEPGFHGARQTLARLGLRAVAIPAHPRDGIDLAALEAAVNVHRPKACWLMAHFQNPLGSLMPDEHKRRLVALLEERNIALVEDDVYTELYFGARRPRALSAFTRRGNVLHCSSFSKSLAPGYRVGWVASPRYAGQLARLQLSTSLAASSPAQLALAEYLARGGYDKHLRQLRQTLMANQARMIDAVKRHFPRGTRTTRPEGGFLLWVELPAAVDTLALQCQAQKLGITIAPGPLFAARGGFRHCMRLNYGLPWDERAEQAIATLGRLIARQQGAGTAI